MDWSHDYCIWCDKQTQPGGLYCSQACRLAELEKQGTSSASPCLTSSIPDVELNWSTTSTSVSPSDTRFRSGTTIKLPPAFNFDAFRSSSSMKIESPPVSPRAASTSNHTSSLQSNQLLASEIRPPPARRSLTEYSVAANKSLNTSSSRSSLSSVSSTSSNQGISDQALSQLQIYSNSFDHTRDWKRRVTFG